MSPYLFSSEHIYMAIKISPSIESDQILIKNKQRLIAIDTSQMHNDMRLLLQKLRYNGFGITILITTDKTIRRYNKQYRNKDTATDILSFPFYPDLLAGKRIIAKNEDEQYLGDLIISAAYVKRNAQELGISITKRMRRLLVHGICHLLGYDHIIDSDWRKMRAKEGFLLKQLELADPLP